jgi:hypothetical protein
MGKKTVVKHRIDGNGVYTVCGRKIGFGTTIRGNKTWKGVTCKKCLMQKAKTQTKIRATAGGV